MSTIHRFRTAIFPLVAVLIFALSTPIAVHAEDEVLVEEQVLTPEDQGPAAADVLLELPLSRYLAAEHPAVRVNPSDDRIANALFDDPIPVLMPRLTDVSATTQTPRLFTVTGKDFTAGGRVYLAIYDQMGAQLYETRWITASRPVPVVWGPTGHEAASITRVGGTLREAFANLCGARAMMRAYDEAATTWSTWLTVEPACAAYVEPHSGPR